MNFPCNRRRIVTAEGEGHQKQEAQSVNPSIGSNEANYIGEEGHQKQEAQSVNSPVKSCVWSDKGVLVRPCFLVPRAARNHQWQRQNFLRVRKWTRSNTRTFDLKKEDGGRIVILVEKTQQEVASINSTTSTDTERSWKAEYFRTDLLQNIGCWRESQ